MSRSIASLSCDIPRFSRSAFSLIAHPPLDINIPKWYTANIPFWYIINIFRRIMYEQEDLFTQKRNWNFHYSTAAHGSRRYPIRNLARLSQTDRFATPTAASLQRAALPKQKPRQRGLTPPIILMMTPKHRRLPKVGSAPAAAYTPTPVRRSRALQRLYACSAW